MSQNDADEVQQASQLLTVHMYCRRQAKALASCVQRGGACAQERAAFTTCSNEHLPAVIDALVKVADQHCQAEVAAYHACKAQSLGSDCEREDLAAMLCASRRVLESASS